MARVTVEDCLENVDNRFELVMVSSKRARQIATGGKEAMVDIENDKPTVLALREIAEGLVGPAILEEPTIVISRDSPLIRSSVHKSQKIPDKGGV